MYKIHHLFNTKTFDALQVLTSQTIEAKDIRLFVKRDDLLHPEVSGNKWRKLKFNLIEARKQNQLTLLTLGGAFSNHIAAVAAAGELLDFETIGIIRGSTSSPTEEIPFLSGKIQIPLGELVEPNPTLAFAEKCGMRLRFVDRTTFRERNEPAFLENLKNEFGNFYFLPEGGTNHLAIKGCSEIIDELEDEMSEPPDFICVAVGTGGTAAGIISQAAVKFPKAKVVCFPALKGNFLQKEIESLLQLQLDNWHLRTEYHFGGYAKWSSELIDFINQFKSNFDIQLEPLYTGKMFYGIFDLIEKNFFPKGSKIVAVHTGGLQGIKGFNQRFGSIILTD